MSKDPVEAVVAAALDAAGIGYTRQPADTLGLDFYVPYWDLYIEVKRFHSVRISEQMPRAPNVIAIQGMGAATAFADLLRLR